MIEHYYEVVKRYELTPPDGIDYKGSCTYCETLEEAITEADNTEADFIYEIGESWDEFMKCEFCGEWVIVGELNNNNCCTRCQLAIWSREGG